jgi:hypothetical protein
MRYFLTFTVAVLAASMAIAQDRSEAELQAADDLSHEYTICSMYYLIRSQCLASRGDAGSLMLAVRSNEALDAAAAYSLSFGKQAGLLPRAIIARQKLAYQAQSHQLEIVKNTYINIGICRHLSSHNGNPGDAFFKKVTAGEGLGLKGSPEPGGLLKPAGPWGSPRRWCRLSLNRLRPGFTLNFAGLLGVVL